MKNSEYYEALGRYVEARESAETFSRARAEKAKAIKEQILIVSENQAKCKNMLKGEPHYL